MSTDAVITVRNLGVRYGATVALADVDIDFRAAEIHALVGENGAGKSTLLRVLAGTTPPTLGKVRCATDTLAWVPQETALPDDLTARDWIFLGRELHSGWRLLRHREMERASAHALEIVGASVAPHRRLGDLPPAQRKLVQIARALHGHPDVLLLDEPTAVLGDQDAQRIFHLIRQLRSAGTAVVYVSHRLEEVLAIADRVTVLRDGRLITTDRAEQVGIPILIQRMVGREIAARRGSDRQLGRKVLRLVSLHSGVVQDVSFSVRGGEIVGLAGLVGAGRSELLEAICGLGRISSGTIDLAAAPVLVPEDRTTNGLIRPLTLRENICLPATGWLRPAAERRIVADLIRELHIRAVGPDADITTLSGGNQQKVLLARALRQKPALLLLDEPTAGVDIGAKTEIQAIIRQLAADGTAIVFASSDLPELLAIADRIVAMRNGRIAGELPIATATEAAIAALITGAQTAFSSPPPAGCSPSGAPR